MKNNQTKTFQLLLTLVLMSTVRPILGQTTSPPDEYINWKGVKIYEFKSATIPDTLEDCYGEWLVKSKATNLNKLTKRTLNQIVKTVKKDNCGIVFVDIKDYWDGKDAWPNYIYCLGLNNKK